MSGKAFVVTLVAPVSAMRPTIFPRLIAADMSISAEPTVLWKEDAAVGVDHAMEGCCSRGHGVEVMLLTLLPNFNQKRRSNSNSSTSQPLPQGPLYGCLFLAAALVYSCLQKEFWRARTDDEELALQEASRELWSLSSSNELISHHFITIPSGTQIHYLASKIAPKTPDTLIVFLHGFPDSSHLFSHQLRSAWSSKAKLVALDLPGCGGSDSLLSYGANDVLNAVGEAITLLKSLCVGSNTRCILVGHDWGGVIGFRLAAETTGLINEFIAVNSIYPRYAATVLKAQVSCAGTLISQGRFRESAFELRPVLSQLRKSGYTYMLTLPIPLSKIMPRLSMCLVKLCHSLEYKKFPDSSSEALARRIALASGPSSLECLQTDKPGYGPSVLARSRAYPPGDWDQRVRLYSDGLLRGEWTPSFLGPRSSVQEALEGSKPRQDTDHWTFRCPVNIVFGLQDVALDPRVVLNGIEKHFAAESKGPLVSSAMAAERITRLPKCGHWSLLEDEGSKALDRVLARIISSSGP